MNMVKNVMSIITTMTMNVTSIITTTIMNVTSIITTTIMNVMNIIMTMIMIAVAMTITTIMRMKYLQAGEKKLLRSIQKKEFEQFLIHYLKKTPMSMELS